MLVVKSLFGSIACLAQIRVKLKEKKEWRLRGEIQDGAVAMPRILCQFQSYQFRYKVETISRKVLELVAVQLSATDQTYLVFTFVHGNV